MFKKALLILSLSFFSGLVSAEYLGLDELPVSDKETNKVLMSAINKKDFKLIKEWKENFKVEYKEDGFCSYIENTLNPSNVSDKTINQDHTSSGFAYFMGGYKTLSITPTHCDNMYMWKLYKALPSKSKSPDIFKLTNSKDKNRDMAIKNKYAEDRDLILDILQNVETSKYQFFLPIIMDSSADHKIRKLAFDKFKVGYEDRANTDEQRYLDLQEKMLLANNENKNWSFGFNDASYMSVVDPKTLLLLKLNEETLDKLQRYSLVFVNHPNEYPVFKKETIKKGGYTDVELASLDLKAMSEHDLLLFNDANESVKMLKKVLDFYLIDHDINFQSAVGNSIFMDLFTNRANYSLQRNVFSGVFIRFYLENGANPLLENKNSKTAFSLFVDKFGDSTSGEEIKEAFIKKQYDFSFNK